MATLSTDCARCGVKSIALNVIANSFRQRSERPDSGVVSEVFCVCPSCKRAAIYVVEKKTYLGSGDDRLDHLMRSIYSNLWSKEGEFSAYTGSIGDCCSILGVVSVKDQAQLPVPDHLPDVIDLVFREANSCLIIGSFNAAGAMYRASIDIATKALLPDGEEPSNRVRRNLGLRLPWMFDNGILPKDVMRLAECIQQDGNDGVHDGTLTKMDAEDLHEFAYALLNRIYTEPEKVRAAEQRREERRRTK